MKKLKSYDCCKYYIEYIWKKNGEVASQLKNSVQAIYCHLFKKLFTGFTLSSKGLTSLQVSYADRSFGVDNFENKWVNMSSETKVIDNSFAATFIYVN